MRYYVLFMDSDSPRWWMKFLRPGFKHCGVLKEIGEGAYVYLENLYNHLHTDLCCMDLNTIQDESGALIVEYETDDSVEFNHFEPITCVTVIKKLIGVADIKVQTPYQLYRYLIKNGGKVWAE